MTSYMPKVISMTSRLVIQDKQKKPLNADVDDEKFILIDCYNCNKYVKINYRKIIDKLNRQ